MKLDENTNYFVSGLERSGTSLLMQMLHTAGVPMVFDHESRQPDENNPKGYFELEGGKIINKLMNGTFPLSGYRGKFIKITAYGLKFLPPGKHKIIYSQRDIEEILDSMEKMARIKDENREETKLSFVRLNDMIKTLIERREDVETLLMNYNEILSQPEENAKKIGDFLGSKDIDLTKMMECIDGKLYRNRR